MKLFAWRKPKPEPIEETAAFQKRLYGVVTRAKAVTIEGNRVAVGAGPDGALWGDDVRAIVLMSDRILAEAA